ncbi:MAG: indolepyruvate ferredoxin oxidoreductase family protein [Hyphomicrobiaceae bacterium]
MLKSTSLSDRVDLSQNEVLLSGAQAIVRLALMQRARDEARGWNTAGYVTGYRGSPLGGLDQEFGRAASLLADRQIKFQPGLNEDLAATAIWGAQQAEMRGEGKYEGVFCIWYGKGPGVDRSGDALRHANLAGTSPRGGVIALMGDDHTCESSTTAHQSEFAFVDAMIPVLSPAGVKELIDYGLHGFQLSRFAGTWCGIKCVKDTVESTASVASDPDAVGDIEIDFDAPPDGLGIRPNDHPNDQEARLHEHKLRAVGAYLRAHRLDRVVLAEGARPRVGIVTAGKSFLDVEDALNQLGIDAAKAAALGLAVYKLACTWPIEPEGLRAFAAGLETLIVVEEKRSLIESQARELLYDLPQRPRIVGKRDELDRWLLPSKGALEVNEIAIAIGERLIARADDEQLRDRLAELRASQTRAGDLVEIASRKPYFCAGCPHSTSTRVPDGSRAYAGIGCHYMAQWMDRATEGYTHMGGEGASWIGEASFSTRDHVFQNMGDGTYNHSGYLALRAAKAAGVNITYKILFNDAVAMTGGQRHEGGLTVDRIARQVAAEGAVRVAIVSDSVDKYPADTDWPRGIEIHDRGELDAVMRSYRDTPGLSVIIYDQTCAAEKRRRRKRGEMPEPQKRVFINELVCEGCGDCGEASNCVAVVPVETEFGRKRTIDQSACNKDFSCLNGFCPSFVTVEGGEAIAPKAAAGRTDGKLPTPPPRTLDAPLSIVVAGVGGTGVVTVAALIAMAAHLEGKGCATLDMAGLAQKGGAVISHLRLAPDQADITAVRVPLGGADLILGCDVVVTASRKVMALMHPARTRIVVNTHRQFPGEFSRNPDMEFPGSRLETTLRKAVAKDAISTLNSNRLAERELGNAVLGNVVLLGYAVQAGLLPLSVEAVEKAIELNGASVQKNLEAFAFGRRIANEDTLGSRREEPGAGAAEGVDAIIDRRVAFLTEYQNGKYAARYLATIAKIRSAESLHRPGEVRLTEVVARNLFKLMAYKDEYEVARLYTSTGFIDGLRAGFKGDFKIRFHLAPPGLARTDPATGRPAKREYSSRIITLLRILKSCRGVRGTPFDPFGYSAHRRLERQLIEDYERLVDEVIGLLTPQSIKDARALLDVPSKIRGYGHIKERNVVLARQEQKRLLEAIRLRRTVYRQDDQHARVAQTETA